jgi:hypothetical protein
MMMPRKNVPTKLVLVGHPRCASRSFALYLKSLGLDVQHEQMGSDGICSWWLAAGYQLRARGFVYGPKEERVLLLPDIICHFMRDPLAAIPSIIIENEFNGRNNNSFRRRSNIIKRHYDVDLAEFDPLSAATLSYIYWNRLAETCCPDLTLKIETVTQDIQLLARYYQLAFNDSVPIANTTANKFGISDKLEVNADALLALVSGKARLYLEKYLVFYGR